MASSCLASLLLALAAVAVASAHGNPSNGTAGEGNQSLLDLLSDHFDECDAHLLHAFHAVGAGACRAAPGEECPQRCATYWHGLLDVCVGETVTVINNRSTVHPFDAPGLALIFAFSGEVTGACRDVPVEGVLNWPGHPATCRNVLTLLKGIAHTPLCGAPAPNGSAADPADEGAADGACPSTCADVIAALRDSCEPAEEIEYSFFGIETNLTASAAAWAYWLEQQMGDSCAAAVDVVGWWAAGQAPEGAVNMSTTPCGEAAAASTTEQAAAEEEEAAPAAPAATTTGNLRR